MKIAKVVGNLVSTIKHPTHTGMKLMIVQPVGFDAKEYGNRMIAVDYACAGVGDFVLLVDEGGASRQIAENEWAAIDAVIAGVLDGVVPARD